MVMVALRNAFIGAFALWLAIGVAARSARAQVKPGDVITPQNAYKVKDLLSPGTYWAVEHGMRIDVVPTQRIDWPPPYKDATEKYSSQVRLTADHRTLEGYVAGQPFPLLDPNDPSIATKIIWNVVYKPFYSDDYDLRFFDCRDLYLTAGKPNSPVINDGWVGHYAGYDEVGRTEVEPLPIDPDFLKTGRTWLFALYPVLAPQSDRGVGLIRYRYADPARGDDSWTWTPGARRLRRLNESILSTASGTTTWDPDHYSGFNPKTEFYDYKFMGDKNMLACVRAIHSPEVTCPYDGGASACPENWEMRHLYVVEAMPRRERAMAAGALDSRTLEYVDAEMWFNPYIDTYDRTGRLWRNHVYWVAYRDRPVPDAKVAIYPFPRLFVVGARSLDVQASYASMCYLPGQDLPERECWYINMGAVDKEFCTVHAMEAAAVSGYGL
jgi:hypothetical protein